MRVHRAARNIPERNRQGQRLGAQTGKEASGFGNEVVMGDLRQTSFGRGMSQGPGRVGRGWIKDVCRLGDKKMDAAGVEGQGYEKDC